MARVHGREAEALQDQDSRETNGRLYIIIVHDIVLYLYSRHDVAL